MHVNGLRKEYMSGKIDIIGHLMAYTYISLIYDNSWFRVGSLCIDNILPRTTRLLSAKYYIR